MCVSSGSLGKVSESYGFLHYKKIFFTTKPRFIRAARRMDYEM